MSDERWRIPVEDFRNLRIKKPQTYAGGIPAVWSSLKVMQRQMGCIRGTRALLGVNQEQGFDCPGCAWPEPEHRQVAEFCENGAKAVAEEATTRTIGREFFAQWSLGALAQHSDYWLSQQGRLVEPLIVRSQADHAHYEPISWEEAFALIAEELHALPTPDDAIFYTSGRTSNEAAFAYQLLVRNFGTNNLPDCSNLCHETSGYAMNQALGVGKGSVSLEDFAHADCIFLIGQNPGTNHPRMLSTLQAAARRGAHLIAVNPLAEAGNSGFIHPQEVTRLLGPATQLSASHLPLAIGGDQALFLALCKDLLEREAAAPEAGQVLAWDFIHQHTSGFADFAASVHALSWESLCREAGLERETIAATTERVLASRSIICCWAMGVTQQPHGVAIVQAIINFLLLRGNMGRPGAGVCPVRGHSNVQGDRTMGIWEKPKPDFLAALGQEFKFQPPHHHGVDVVEAIRAMHAAAPTRKVFMAMGGNFLSASPDTAFTAQALARCRLTVHIATKLNRSHLQPGARGLILPCLVRSEQDRQASGLQFVTVENSMGIVSRSQGLLAPLSAQLKSEVRIVAELAQRVFAGAQAGKRAVVDWSAWADNYDLIRASIARVVPGFDDFATRIKQRPSLTLPHPIRDRCEFPTPDGKAHFMVQALAVLPRLAHQYCLMTMRSHDQYNTTIYGLDDRYRGIYGGRRVVFINPEDMVEAGFQAGELVDIVSEYKGQRRQAASFKLVPYAIPRRCLGAYFPEANCLVPVDSVAEGSNTPTSKRVLVELLPAGTL